MFPWNTMVMFSHSCSTTKLRVLKSLYQLLEAPVNRILRWFNMFAWRPLAVENASKRLYKAISAGGSPTAWAFSMEPVKCEIDVKFNKEADSLCLHDILLKEEVVSLACECKTKLHLQCCMDWLIGGGDGVRVVEQQQQPGTLITEGGDAPSQKEQQQHFAELELCDDALLDLECPKKTTSSFFPYVKLKPRCPACRRRVKIFSPPYNHLRRYDDGSVALVSSFPCAGPCNEQAGPSPCK